jgi:guanylate kinase
LFRFGVSHTTRSPRDGEVDGVDYWFVDESVMRSMIDDALFVEWAEVHGNYYGTTYGELYGAAGAAGAAGGSDKQRVIIDIDVQGVKTMKSNELNVSNESNVSNVSNVSRVKPYYIFLTPSNISDIKERLIKRNTETSLSMKKRFDAVVSEIEYGKSGVFDEIVWSDDMDDGWNLFMDAIRRGVDDDCFWE